MREIIDLETFKELLKIDPNKSYPFVSCKEMALLSVMKYYGINELSMMVKMNFMYKFYKENQYVVFSCINPDLYSDKNFFDSVGIAENIISLKEDSLNCIKRCIENKHPVFFDIDLYYQEGRELFYKIRHAAHTLIAYGFDDEKQILYVLDNIQGYDKCEIKYSDYPILRGDVKGSDIVEYIKTKNIDTYSEEFENKMLDIYVNGIKNQYEMRKDALENIVLLIDNFASSVSRQEFGNDIISVIYEKVSEFYRMTFLKKYHLYSEQGQQKIEKLLNDIISKWKRVFLLIQYLAISSYGNEDYSKPIKCLYDIYEIEKELCECLIKQLL